MNAQKALFRCGSVKWWLNCLVVYAQKLTSGRRTMTHSLNAGGVRAYSCYDIEANP